MSYGILVIYANNLISENVTLRITNSFFLSWNWTLEPTLLIVLIFFMDNSDFEGF